MVASNNIGKMVVSLETDPSKLGKQLIEAKRDMSNFVSQNRIKVPIETTYEERLVVGQMNKMISVMEKEAARQTAKIRLFGEAAPEIKLAPRFSVKEQSIRDGMADVKKQLRAQAQSESIEVEVKTRIKTEHDANTGDSTLFRRFRTENRSVTDQDDRGYVATTTRRIRQQAREQETESRFMRDLMPLDADKEARDRFAGTGPKGLTKGGLKKPTLGGLSSALGAVASSYVLSEGLRIGSEVFSDENRRLARSDDPTNQAQLRLNRLQTLKSIPLIGGIASAADSITGFSSAEQRNIDDRGRQVDAVKSAKESVYSSRESLAAARGDTVGAARLSGEGAIAAAKRLVLDGGGAMAIEQVNNARKMQEIAVSDAMEKRGSQLEMIRQSSIGTDLRGQAISAREGGDSAKAERIERAAGRNDILSRQAGELVGEKDQEKRKRMLESQAKELAAFDAESQAQAEDKKKQKSADSATARGAAAESALRIQRKTYEADLSAFDTASKAKLSLIKDLDERQNESARDAAQRATMVAEHERQVKETVAQLDGNIEVRSLRAKRDNDAAALKEYDKAAQARLDAVDKSDKKLVEKVKADNKSGRDLLETQQGWNQADFNSSQTARRESARARGRGFDQLSGVIGSIAAMQDEIRNAEADKRESIIETDRIELKSMRDSIIRPNSYATEWDPMRQAPGGPMGDRGNEMVEILKRIDDAIRGTSLMRTK